MATASGHTSAIRATKVCGTPVHDKSGKKIGEVEDILLDKLSNNILFAVVSFGGFLGMAEKYHPVPWSSLKYDKGRATTSWSSPGSSSRPRRSRSSTS